MDGLVIRDYRSGDAAAIAQLFHAAVHRVAASAYSPAQCEAWAPTPPDMVFWETRLAETRPLVAEWQRQTVGFIELRPGGHIDCCYTDPDYQRRGIASALYRVLEESARSRGITRLTVEASLIARPFFSHLGFTVINQQSVERSGERLVNFLMEKNLRA